MYIVHLWYYWNKQALLESKIQGKVAIFNKLMIESIKSIKIQKYVSQYSHFNQSQLFNTFDTTFIDHD